MDHHAEESKGKAQFSREEADAIVSEHVRLTAELTRTQAQIQHATSVILSMSQYAELKKEIHELRQEVAELKAAAPIRQQAPEYNASRGVNAPKVNLPITDLEREFNEYYQCN